MVPGGVRHRGLQRYGIFFGDAAAAGGFVVVVPVFVHLEPELLLWRRGHLSRIDDISVSGVRDGVGAAFVSARKLLDPDGSAEADLLAGRTAGLGAASGGVRVVRPGRIGPVDGGARHDAAGPSAALPARAALAIHGPVGSDVGGERESVIG